MAITVTLKITSTDIPKKEVSVTATYTDDVDSSNTKTISMTNVIIDTSEQKTAILNEIENQYNALLIKDTAIAAYIADLETVGSANLQGRL